MVTSYCLSLFAIYWSLFFPPEWELYISSGENTGVTRKPISKLYDNVVLFFLSDPVFIVASKCYVDVNKSYYSSFLTTSHSIFFYTVAPNEILDGSCGSLVLLPLLKSYIGVLHLSPYCHGNYLASLGDTWFVVRSRPIFLTISGLTHTLLIRVDSSIGQVVVW